MLNGQIETLHESIKHARAVARSEKSLGPRSNVVGIMCPPVETGLTDRPKTGAP